MEIDSLSFDDLLSKTLIDYKISSADGAISGYVDSEEAFRDLMTNIQARGYCYSIRGSHLYHPPKKTKTSKQGGDTPSEEKPPDDEAFEEKGKKNIHFKSQLGSVPIGYFGSAFTIERNTYFECSQGPRYYKKKIPKENSELDPYTGIERIIKRRNTPSKKRNCPATILLKCIRIYPEFNVTTTKEPHWKQKKEITNDIRKAFKSSPGPQSFLRYYIKASPQDSHSHESAADKEMRLLAAYELKRERRRMYKQAHLMRKRQMMRGIQEAMNGATGPKKIRSKQVTHRKKMDIKEENLEVQCAAEELELEMLQQEAPELGEEQIIIGEEQIELEVGHMEINDNLHIEIEEDLQLQIQEGQIEIEEEDDDGDISELLLSLRKEAQKIVNLSSTCSNVHAISQAMSLLQEASKLLDEPPPTLVTSSTGVKTVAIPVHEVFTSSSDDFFTFTLNESCGKPTCVVFVQ